jgi:hypothetical protein
VALGLGLGGRPDQGEGGGGEVLDDPVVQVRAMRRRSVSAASTARRSSRSRSLNDASSRRAVDQARGSWSKVSSSRAPTVMGTNRRHMAPALAVTEL